MQQTLEQLGHIPNLDDSAVEVLRAQEGIGLDLPPQTIIFTDSLSTKAAAKKKWVSDRMRHTRYSLYFVRSRLGAMEHSSVSRLLSLVTTDGTHRGPGRGAPTQAEAAF